MAVSSEPLVMGRARPVPYPTFRPRWPWFGGDLQTIRNTLNWRAPDFSAYKSERLTLPMDDGSGDRLIATLNLPLHNSGKPVVILVHGLTGSEDSRNIRTSAGYHLSREYPVIRLNLRGAGPSRGMCRASYHAGRSRDIHDALAALPAELTACGILLVGASLGGNVCLKFLAEYTGKFNILAAATVCAPIDLKMAQERIGAARNAIYQRHLLKSMREDALAAAGTTRETASEMLKSIHTVYDFDDKIVAPAGGFAGAEDYYRRCSAGSLLGDIRIPTLLIHSLDDPWIPASMYLDRSWSPNGPLTLLMAPGGGHVGFHDAAHTVPWHNRCIGLFFDHVAA